MKKVWNAEEKLRFERALEEKGYSFGWDDATPAYLAQKAYGQNRGARDLRNTVRRLAEDKIALALIENAEKQVKGFVLNQDELTVVFE